MGTHPIFESDFDCLTEKKTKMSYKVAAPITNPNALKPAGNDDQLIKPKPVPNPIKESDLHSALNRELKIKSKSGTVFPQKSELEKAFHNRRVQKIQKKEIPDERTDIEIELTSRLDQQKAKLDPQPQIEPKMEVTPVQH